MNEKTMTFVVVAIGAYVLFVHNGGLLSTGTTAASPPPPPKMPQQDNTGAIAGAVQSGLDLVRSIFDAASGSTGTRGSGVANV